MSIEHCKHEPLKQQQHQGCVNAPLKGGLAHALASAESGGKRVRVELVKDEQSDPISVWAIVLDNTVTLEHDYPDAGIEAGWVIKGVGVVSEVSGRVLTCK